MRHRIYIAGPYCPYNSAGKVVECDVHDGIRIAQHNVNKAIEVANALIEKGHHVFVPHLTHYIHTHSSCKRDYKYYWYELDITFLELWATSLFLIEHSNGADMELKRAKELGLKIFYNLNEVEDVV